jgi:hypothetical protein
MRKLIVLISLIVLTQKGITQTPQIISDSIPSFSTLCIPLYQLKAVAKSNEIGKVAQREVAISRILIDSLKNQIALSKILFQNYEQQIALYKKNATLDSLLLVNKDDQLSNKQKENDLNKSYIDAANKKTKKANKTTWLVAIFGAGVEAATIYLLAR